MWRRAQTWIVILSAAVAFGGASTAYASPVEPGGALPPGVAVRGWTILSNNDTGADAVIAAARQYQINHLQLSHQIVFDLRELRDPAKQAQTNRLTDAAHRAGIGEVAVWDHALYDLSYYPAEFRTGPDGTIDLDNPEFWTWFKQDYRSMLDLVPHNNAVILTFIETGARVERQYSVRLKTEAEKLAYLVDQVASVVVDERHQNLYLRTFGYFPAEIERNVGAINMVHTNGVRVMAKATPHDFFLTHPNDRWVQTINRPTIIEFDATGEYNGQGKIAGAWPQEHINRWRYFQTLPNVIGYTARTDRYDESRIIGTPTEINLYALYRATQNPHVSVETIYREFTASTYGGLAAPHVQAALARSFDIVTSGLYSLGTNTANHSRLDYEPYCSSYHRSVSGKWIDPPEVTVGHDVNRRFHYWIDVVDHLSPPACKTDGVLAREAGYVLDNGWVRLGNNMQQPYLDYIIEEKNWSVRQAEAALADIEAARAALRPAQYQQLKAYFERTLLTVRLHRSVSKAYFGYRIWVRDPSFQTPELQRTIWDGLREAQQVAALVRAYPAPAASGEWNWVIDAAQADPEEGGAPLGGRPEQAEDGSEQEHQGHYQAGDAQPPPQQPGTQPGEGDRRGERGDREDHGHPSLELEQRQDGCWLVRVRHADQRGFRGVGDEAQRHEGGSGDEDRDRQGLLAGPPEDGHERGDEGDEGEQRQPDGHLAGAQGAAVRDVVRRHGSPGRAIRPQPLQHKMDDVQDYERQAARRGQAQRSSPYVHGAHVGRHRIIMRRATY